MKSILLRIVISLAALMLGLLATAAAYGIYVLLAHSLDSYNV